VAKYQIALAAAITMLAPMNSGWAAAPPTQLQRLQACATLADDASRLACYDEQINRASPAAAPEAAAAPPHEDFGVAGSELARRRDAERRQDNLPAEPMIATVTLLSRLSHGEIVMTLSNEQVWRQKKPDPYFPVKVGDSIRIEPGLLGSYRLFLPAGRFSQVTRVR
jgi:hypothetical protein